MSLPHADLTVRDAVLADIDALTRIYAWHVLHGCGSFEETPPDAAEMADRYRKVASFDLPWLVAERDGQVVGYCYATQYRPVRLIALPSKTRFILMPTRADEASAPHCSPR